MGLLHAQTMPTCSVESHAEVSERVRALEYTATSVENGHLF